MLFRTQSTLLSVISNLGVGSSLAILHGKAYKTCFRWDRSSPKIRYRVVFFLLVWPHDLVSKQLANFSRYSKKLLIQWCCTRTFDLNFFGHKTTSYAEKNQIVVYAWYFVLFNFRVVEQLQQKKHRVRHFNIFPCFTVCTFARNLERDGLGRFCSTNRKIPFHSSHGIPEISNQNFWSNGKRPLFMSSLQAIFPSLFMSY